MYHAGCQKLYGTCNPTVSTDGSCGDTNGYTCQGSTYGNCCSPSGYCGGSSAYCGTGQLASFIDKSKLTDQDANRRTGAAGSPVRLFWRLLLPLSRTTSFFASPTGTSSDGKCGSSYGSSCTGSSFGQCCRGAIRSSKLVSY